MSSSDEQIENPSMSLRDMMGDDELDQSGDFVLEKTSLRTGIQGNTIPDPPIPAGHNPNATHWVFNPYAIIDLTNQGAGSGMLYLQNVVFNRLRSIPTLVGKDFRETTSKPTTAVRTDELLNGATHNPGNYVRFNRTARMIADEMEQKYGGKGITVIHELTGLEDDAHDINQILFGEEIECVVDFNNPDFPCPVLPNLLEVMHANIADLGGERGRGMKQEEKRLIAAVGTRVRRAIRNAMQHARDGIEEGQKRLLDDKAVNRFLSHHEQRSYLALGLGVPTWQPTARGMQQHSAVPNGELAAAVSAGVAQAFRENGNAAAPVPANTDLVDTSELNKIVGPPPERKKPTRVTVQSGAVGVGTSTTEDLTEKE